MRYFEGAATSAPLFFRTARSCLICMAANAQNTERAPKTIQSHFGNQLQRDQSSTVVSSPLASRMATATSVMAVVIPTQNRNAAVATDNMTKMMAINLKIPKYDISSAPDDRSLGVGPSNCSNCSRQGSPWMHSRGLLLRRVCRTCADRRADKSHA